MRTPSLSLSFWFALSIGTWMFPATGLAQSKTRPVLDLDGDGFTFLEGDCAEVPGLDVLHPERVNPGVGEVLGNGIDDDCDGAIDNAPPVCSTTTNLDAVALDLVQAMDLCRLTTGGSGPWGLISAEVTRADGSGAPEPIQVSVKTGFGGFVPRVGATMTLLSTGVARAEADPGFVSQASCSGSPGGVAHGSAVPAPAEWLAANGGSLVGAPGCDEPSTTVRDSLNLRLRIRVPTNAVALRFHHAFFVSDWPDTCIVYNDHALALVTEGRAAGVPLDGNVMLDRVANPLTLQTATFDVCAGCLQGPLSLAGTGYTAATSWTEAVVPVVPGAEMTLEFHLWDAEDGFCDSALLLDGLRFDVIP